MGGKRRKYSPPAANGHATAAFVAATKPVVPLLDADAILIRASHHLDRLQDLVEGAISEGSADPATIRESHGVARVQVAIVAELRARERHNASLAKKLSPQLVMAYLRQLEPEERAHVVRELVAMDAEASVLS